MKIIELPVNEITIKDRKRKLDPEKVKELSESIAQLGMLHPIGIRPDKTLVFGYHRLAAVNRLGWKTVPAVIVDTGELEAELAEIDENLIRAELTILERAEHLARRKEIYEALHPETKAGAARALGMHRALGHNVGTTVVPTFTEDVARKTGLSQSTVKGDIQIATRILPEVRDALRSTELANSKRDLLRIARLEPELQKIVAEQITSGEEHVSTAIFRARTELAAQKVRELPPEVTLIEGDFREVGGRIPDNSVDFVFTDPPWGYVELYEDLAKLAARVLKPGGSLLCYSGTLILPEALKLMTQHLRYWWTLATLYPGQQGTVIRKRVIVGWKPILWFVKGDLERDICIRDVLSGPRDKDYHEWQMRMSDPLYCIEQFTLPGDTVLDPMAGTGTTLCAALKLKRKAIGIEVDPKKIPVIKERLNDDV